jgi:hypothetical protein
MYTLVLSVEEHDLMHSTDFQKIMEQDHHFVDWRVIEHTNTEHDHAHVIAFRDERLSGNAFKTWQQETCEHITELEHSRQLEMTRTLEQEQGIDIWGRDQRQIWQDIEEHLQRDLHQELQQEHQLQMQRQLELG